ncbi:MAG: zinc metallopeptidase [Chloroflexi bacterium]|nr:zinc metallopeptidase [Chloroflexota bacterium]
MFFYSGWGLWLLLALPGLLLGLWAQAKVKGAFNKYSKVPTSRRQTGAKMARELLDSQGLYEVQIERVDGRLSDHYDPRHRVLRLSPNVYDSASIAAAGVAAHEMGHALQHANGYAPLGIRSALVPATQFGSRLAPMLFMGGLLLNIFIGGQLGMLLAWAGVALFTVAVLFTLVTLPVEFDASKRAKKLLLNQGILFQDEIQGVNKVLDAAALTYVAAAVAAIGQLLYYVLLLTGGRRN